MTDHAQAPETGTDTPTLLPTNDNLTGHLSRTLHLTLEQHSAYVALEQLVDLLGFHEILDDTALICRTLRCTPEHWHDHIAPAVVPVLESSLEDVA